MKTQVTLDTKDVRKIIADHLSIREEQVIPQRYSYAIEGLPAEEIRKRIYVEDNHDRQE